MIASSTDQKVQSYIDAVLADRVVVCKTIRAAVERHVRDLERAENDPKFPFRYDPIRASIALDFIEMIIKHSTGEFAGLPFLLEPWQAFGIAMMFGWVRVDDNSRRFRKVYWSMGRKNGKSMIGAALALFLASMDINPITMTPEAVAEIVLSATKREQVEKVIYQEIERMRVQSPILMQRSTDINKQIKFGHNDGTIICVGSDKPYDGLNPSAVIMDEVHAWRERHREFYNTMQTGSINRVQPLLITLTTAGDDKSYIWLEEYRYAKNVVLDVYKDESLFAFIFEIDDGDDPLDPEMWIKANPNLHVSVRFSFLEEEANRAAHSKLIKNRFTRYHANQLVTSTEAAFEIPQWDRCCGKLSDWNEADAIGVGIDLGGRDDFAAWGAVARFIHSVKKVDEEADKKDLEDGKQEESIYNFRYEIRAHVYIAEDTERDLTQAPFAQWVQDGRIKVVKYPISEMIRDILAFADEYEIEDAAYDPAGGQTMAEMLEQEGIIAARMPQTYAMFNEPLNDFKQAMSDGRLLHDGCPVLRWCIGNAVACRDRQDRWMLDKKSSIEKIDPAVSVVMGYRRAMVAAGRSTDNNLIVTQS